MKTKSSYLLLSTLIGGLLFNLLFWSEKLALNLFLYSLFVLTVTFFNSEIVKSKRFNLYELSHLFAAILVVVNNSDLSLAAYYISFILFVGFSHYPRIRTVWAAFLATWLQMVTVPANFIKQMSELQIGNYSLKPIFRPIKYIILPLFIIFIFTAIYSGANKIFGSYLSSIFEQVLSALTSVFGFIFRDLSFERFVHFCFGTAVTGGLIITFYNRIIENNEAKLSEKLIRKRVNQENRTLLGEISHFFMGQFVTKKLALKTEYIIAVISFAALNLLLLFLNGIDIWWLWLGNADTLGKIDYSAALHDGTNALIFSILLAMAIIIYFFRGNLNFFSKSKPLKTLAFIWMVQNFILVISVFIRDFHYVEAHGLTYKRIGVLVFSILCIIGLATVYIKVAQQKTLFYLFRINGNIWYILLLACSAINWDVAIVKYNLANQSTIDLDKEYLLSLSNKILPILDQHRKILATPPSNTADYDQPLSRLDRRIDYFKEQYGQQTWLSWNVPDWKTANYFNVKP